MSQVESSLQDRSRADVILLYMTAYQVQMLSDVKTIPSMNEIVSDFRTTATKFETHTLELFQEIRGVLENKQGTATILTQLERAASENPHKSKIKSNFFRALIRWLKSKPQTVHQLFQEHLSKELYKSLSATVDEDDPETLIRALANIPPASGSPLLRSWILKVASASEVGLTDIEIQLGNIQTGVALGTTLKKVGDDLASTDPMSDASAALTDRKYTTQADLQDLINDSPSGKDAILSSASETMNRRSELAQKLGLDSEQEVAMVTNGKQVIAAGAGSGKTRVICAKVAYNIQEGVPPQQIMVTSFTAESAKELKERLHGMGISEVRVGTTHSIAGEIIRAYRPGLISAMNKAATGAPDSLFRRACIQVTLRRDADVWAPEGGSTSPFWKKPAKQWFNLGTPLVHRKKPIPPRMLRSMIGKWKNSGTSVEDARELALDKSSSDLLYLASAVYGAYEWLKRNDTVDGPCMDFDDWLAVAESTLRNNPQALAEVQSQYSVVLVDEAQDQNHLQHQLFGMIGEKAKTLAYIGDDSQAIYEFRGANPQKFITLKDQGFKVMKISTNYRSGKPIVQAANNLIAHNKDRQIQKVCNPSERNMNRGFITARDFGDHEEVSSYVANQIGASVSSGASPDEFGIVVRNNGETEAFCLSLAANGIPFRTNSTIGFFNKTLVRSILSWMKIAITPVDDRTAMNDAIMKCHENPKFMLGAKFESALASRSGKNPNYYSHLLLRDGNVFSPSEIQSLPRTEQRYAATMNQNAKKYFQCIQDIRNTATTSSTQSILVNILEMAGSAGTSIRDMLIEDLDLEELTGKDAQKLTEDEIKAIAFAPIRPIQVIAASPRFVNDPEQFLKFIQTLKDLNDKNHKSKDSKDAAVRVDTCHQWKGLEADNVYCLMSKGVFPNFRADKEAEKGDVTAYDSERRLAYVALTRGRQSVTVVSSETNYLGKSSDGSGISRFVSEACINIEQPSKSDTEDELSKSSSSFSF